MGWRYFIGVDWLVIRRFQESRVPISTQRLAMLTEVFLLSL
jgi:hypothetical protein